MTNLGGIGLFRYLGAAVVFFFLGRRFCDDDLKLKPNNWTPVSSSSSSTNTLRGADSNVSSTQSDTNALVENIPQQQQQVQPHEQIIQQQQPTRTWTPLFHEGITDPWKQKIYAQIDRVREKCGPLCRINNRHDYDTHGLVDLGKRFKTFQTPINCQQLFEMEEIDAGDTSVPYPVPDELKPLYSLDGAINIAYSYGKQNQIYLGGQAKQNVWTIEDIHRDLNLLKEGRLPGSYDARTTNEVRDRLMQQGGLAGKTVLVVGSQRPWVEVIALYAGAAKVVTLEYGAIESHHPQISTMTPDVFRQKYFEKQLPQFDAVLTYSSIEHSGLGRYGDALNPWGDILSLARCWCVAKDDAMLLLGVPVGPDAVEFNAHRVYGDIRLPILTTNWVASDGATSYQSRTTNLGLHFFRKLPGPAVV
mgnify:CR=1 FL=1